MTVPHWFESAAQGLAFWIGAQQEIYYYALGESALRSELCNRIRVGLGSDFRLRAEESYSQFLPSNHKYRTLTKRSRVDLVVIERRKKQSGEYVENPKFFVELKRSSSSSKEIKKDLCRLAEMLSKKRTARAFLVITSQKLRPDNWVSEAGRSRRKKLEINSDYWGEIRCVKKALAGKPNLDKGHYVCLIEIKRS